MAYSLQFSRGRDTIQTKAISPLPSSEGPSCCLLENIICLWYLSCSRHPPPLGKVCSVGVPAGITVLTVIKAVDSVAKWHSSFQARLSSVCTACAKLIHVGHSLCLRKSKILEPALMAGAQPSSLSGEGGPACPWGGGADFVQEGRRQTEGQESRGGTGCRDCQQCSPCSEVSMLTPHGKKSISLRSLAPLTPKQAEGELTFTASFFFFTDNISWILAWFTASGSFASPVARQQAFPPLSTLLLPDIFPLILMVTHLALTGITLVCPENFSKGWLRVPIPVNSSKTFKVSVTESNWDQVCLWMGNVSGYHKDCSFEK